MAKNKSSKTPHYELLFIMSNKFTEDETKPIIEEVRKIIETHGGKVTFDEFWGKKELAYSIEHFNHGYYSLFEFDAAGEKMTRIDKDLRMHRKVLRHQIVTKLFRTPEQIAQEKIDSKEKADKLKNDANSKDEKEKEVVKETKKKEVAKVNLKELDEKLDKILETDDLL
jgi:small subunit ribosomal protein S6